MAPTTQFKALLDAAHDRGIRVCLDLVAGHTSDQHPWFVQSQRAEPNEFTHRYVWTNNPWVKRDGELDFISGNSDRAGAYAVNFFAHQPALNYGFANPERSYQQDVDGPGPRATRAALKEIMKFWLDLGVDGFRVDLAASLVKSDPERIGIRRLWREIRTWLDDHYQDRVLISEWGNPELAIDAGFHADFMQHVGVGGYDALLLGPESFPKRRTTPYFDSSGRGDFRRFWTAFDFQEKRIAGRGLISLPIVESRFRAAAARPRTRRPESIVHVSADMAAIAVHLLRRRDRYALHTGLTSREGGFERTGSRTPMQWDGSPLGGFSTNPNATPYLPIDPLADRPTVAAQRADRDSLWHHVERLIYLRVTESDLAPDTSLVVLSETSPGYPLVYRRGGSLIVAINPGLDSHTVLVAAARRRGRRAIASLPGDARVEGLATARRAARLRGVHGAVGDFSRVVAGDRCCGRASSESDAAHTHLRRESKLHPTTLIRRETVNRPENRVSPSRKCRHAWL